jgi:hypothetical protein
MNCLPAYGFFTFCWVRADNGQFTATGEKRTLQPDAADWVDAWGTAEFSLSFVIAVHLMRNSRIGCTCKIFLQRFLARGKKGNLSLVTAAPAIVRLHVMHSEMMQTVHF